MRARRGHSQKGSALIHEYGDRVGTIVRRRHTEAALLAANQQADRNAEAARRAMMRADKASRAKSEFLAKMSHELRTPLNAIIGFSDLLGQDSVIADHDKVRGYGLDINAASRRLLGIINDILDIARIEAGQTENRGAVVDIRHCIKFCLTRIEPQARESGLTVHTRLPHSLPGLIGDELRVQQILLHLLSNAVKFTPEGGSVTAEAAVNDDGDLVITIGDTGIGMSSEGAKRALAPFVQLQEENSRQYKGSGLGLTLSKALVELYGGTLALNSEPDVGTVVTIEFPADRLVALDGAPDAAPDFTQKPANSRQQA